MQMLACFYKLMLSPMPGSLCDGMSACGLAYAGRFMFQSMGSQTPCVKRPNEKIVPAVLFS
jgi:hypothetical protein